MENEQDDRPSILRSVAREKFEQLVSADDARIASALEQGSIDRANAEAEAEPPVIESNLRFA